MAKDAQAKIYGTWLKPNFDYTDVKAKLDALHGENYERYKSRRRHFEAIAELFVADAEESYPSLKGKLFVNFAAISMGLAKYFNDVVHYKLWHPITYINKARVISYSAHWMLLHAPVSLALSRAEYSVLDKRTRKFVLELNTHFILMMIKWYMRGFGVSHSPVVLNTIYKRVAYLIKTGQFEAKNIAVAFEVAL